MYLSESTSKQAELHNDSAALPWTTWEKKQDFCPKEPMPAPMPLFVCAV